MPSGESKVETAWMSEAVAGSLDAWWLASVRICASNAVPPRRRVHRSSSLSALPAAGYSLLHQKDGGQHRLSHSSLWMRYSLVLADQRQDLRRRCSSLKVRQRPPNASCPFARRRDVLVAEVGAEKVIVAAGGASDQVR